MNVVKLCCVPLMAVILLVGAGVVHAESITIVNPSFETPVIDPPVGGIGTSPDPWVNGGPFSGGYYTLDPLGPFSGWTAPPPDGGVQVMMLGNVGHGNSQFLAATLEANTTYTLQMDVSVRESHVPLVGDMNIGYGAPHGDGSDSLNENLLATATSSLPLPGTGEWVLWEKTFETGASPLGLGEVLRVDLLGGYRLLYDNVRLDATPVPELSTLLYLVGMFFGIGFLGRFSKK